MASGCSTGHGHPSDSPSVVHIGLTLTRTLAAVGSGTQTWPLVAARAQTPPWSQAAAQIILFHPGPHGMVVAIFRMSLPYLNFSGNVLTDTDPGVCFHSDYKSIKLTGKMNHHKKLGSQNNAIESLPPRISGHLPEPPKLLASGNGDHISSDQCMEE